MLQRQIMFKQLQAMQQQQQQLLELSDARQHHYLNQLSFLNKQTSTSFQPPLINGMPIQDPSQMFMGGNIHLTQRGTPPFVQAFPNGNALPQAQNQPIYSMGLLQPIDVSSFGNPAGDSGNNMNSFSHFQGASYDSSIMMNISSNSQLELQPSIVGNSFLNEQFNASVNKVCMTDGIFVPKNSGDKNFSGQVMQASEDGALPVNFQQPDFLQNNTLMKESAMRQEQAGWPLHPAGSKLETSRDAVSLDPLEEKILFNTDDNSWDSSFGLHSSVGTVGFDSSRQHLDFMGSFSSNHCGSWSALMQSAVAEASSSDTGQQEEWSGLTFQNPELSTDNNHTNYMSDGQQRSWVNNNLQSISSPPSEPEVQFQLPNVNCSFPTFQESENQVLGQEGMHSDLCESIQQSPKDVSKWFDCNSQQKLPVEGCQLVRTLPALQNAWHNRRPEHSQNDRSQLSISSHTMGSQHYNSLTGHAPKVNTWRHESGYQYIVGGSQRSADQGRHYWSNQEQGYAGQSNYVENVTDIGMSSEKVHSPETVPLSQIQSHNNGPFYHKSSASSDLRLLAPLPQQLPKSSYSSPLQRNSSVENASEPVYQNSQLKLQYNSVAPVGNQSSCAALPSATDRFQAGVATSRDCYLFQPTIEDSTNSNMGNASGSRHEQYKQSCFHTRDNIKEVNACSEKSFDGKADHVDQLNSCEASTPFLINRAAHGREAVPKHLLGTNSTSVPSTTTPLQAFDKAEQRDNNTPNVSARDLEAFGRYLGPHRLLHQVNANARQTLFGLQSGVQNLFPGDADVISQPNPISSGDNKSIIYSSGAGGNHSGVQLSEAFVQDHRVLGENNSGTIPKEQSQINIQMGSSWFRQYGTLINGQMLPVPDRTHTVTSDGKSGEALQLITSIRQVDPSNASQVSSTLPNLDMNKVTSPGLSSQFSLPPGNIQQSKKRKFSAFDLLPWHKEVTRSLQQLHEFSSMAEAEWALASNRLTAKVEDEAEIMEDVSPSSQARKRLALTTKLMQQVFRPAPKVILSADASANSESVVYFTARLALGDACSMTTGSRKRPLTSDMSLKEMTTAEIIGQLDFVRAVEHFNDWAKRLENDLLRLEKSASVVNIKVDSQDLEKFSVINRFAKFHTRAHSASSASGSSPPKPVPQRYVVAHPMPKALPEGTNCISL